MFQVCPKCNKTVKSNQALFCYHCGAIIGSQNKHNAESANEALKETSETPNKEPSKTKKGSALKIPILLFFLILIIAGGYFGYVKFKDRENATSEIVNPMDQTKNQKFEIDFSDHDIKLSTGKLDKETLAQLSPVGIDSFIVLNSPDAFYENFIENNSKVDINKLTGLSVEEIASFLEPSFSIVTRENSWAFTAKTKNKKFLETKLEEMDTKNLEFEIALIGDFLVISNDVNIVNEMEGIEKGVSLGLSKDAFFVEATKNLPMEGIALVFYRDVNKLKPLLKKILNGDEEKIDPKGKSAFVATKSGKGAILQF